MYFGYIFIKKNGVFKVTEWRRRNTIAEKGQPGRTEKRNAEEDKNTSHFLAKAIFFGPVTTNTDGENNNVVFIVCVWTFGD